MNASKIIRFIIIILAPILLFFITYKVAMNREGEFILSENWSIWFIYLLVVIYLEYRLVTNTSRE